MTQQKPIRVAVAADQDIYRRGLVSLVISLNHTRLVGEARDETEVIQLCEMLEPDMLLLNLKNLPEGGKEFARSIHKRWPRIKLIFFLSSHEENQPYEDTGQDDMICFSKDISEEEFSSAILEIHGTLSGINASAKSQDVLVSGKTDPNFPETPAHSYTRESFEDGRTRELQMAGRVQADIMPENVPSILGWQIAAKLDAARETSGDFFDFIPLDAQRWGIVIGDVTDKGIGAALFMALTSTLIRTYAARYPTLPALTMDVVNQRMLSDSRGSMFVTTFFGILEPSLGRLRYVNAGHPPALLVSSRGAKPVDQLQPTGMALGMVEKTHWRQKVCKLAPGDVLLLYTDGVSEAQNRRGESYGDRRLIQLVRGIAGKPASQILETVLADVYDFATESSQRDDIALIVVRRNQ